MAGPWNSQRFPVHGRGYDTQSGGSIHLQGFSIVGTALMILGFLLGLRLVRAMKKSGELRMPWVGLRMIVGMD
jgi:hypothetical protein